MNNNLKAFIIFPKKLCLYFEQDTQSIKLENLQKSRLYETRNMTLSPTFKYPKLSLRLILKSAKTKFFRNTEFFSILFEYPNMQLRCNLQNCIRFSIFRKVIHIKNASLRIGVSTNVIFNKIKTEPIKRTGPVSFKAPKSIYYTNTIIINF